MLKIAAAKKNKIEIQESIMAIIIKHPGNLLLGSKFLPQCLHTFASSWISSAQKGHFCIGKLQ
jgi:hypothetical protein